MSDEFRDEAGRFIAGNRFWEARSSAGPKPKFDGPEKLLAAINEYFEWNEVGRDCGLFAGGADGAVCVFVGDNGR